ncbi:MAG: O-acetyl-ADP-ribose deacetylase [Nocardioides sp.]
MGIDLTVVAGDITDQRVDAVVNAANERMRGGGGVDGALHRAAGPGLLAECRERFPSGLPTGRAGWTHGHDLPASWVIHVVGPVYDGTGGNRDLLVSCYANALAVADELGVTSIAFPLVSAGVYGWPLHDAIAAAVDTIRSTTSTSVTSARIVAFGRSTYDAVTDYLAR